MGLAGEVLNFFSLYNLATIHQNQPPSLNDCLNHFTGRGAEVQLRTLLAIVKKFEHEGFVLKIGQKGNDPIYDSTYVAQHISNDYLKYGAYDFYFQGFASIREYFSKSVLPMDVRKRNDDPDIGTCFVVDSHQILTARHCIESKNNIKIYDPHRQLIKPDSIWVPSDGKDIALIEMNYYNFSVVPKFSIQYGRVLDEVLTMGYPPIPGFDSIIISDLAHIGTSIKVSKGRIIGEGDMLFDRESYFLINAKVKGGNSGGPIINNLGYVTGMLVSISLDPDDQKNLDHLAYGIAVTGTQINNFLKNVRLQNEKVQKMPFCINKNGFAT
ncbi:MAG TPA: serine protease [Puia sp.]|nr:serine protease [Puia sp.]